MNLEFTCKPRTPRLTSYEVGGRKPALAAATICPRFDSLFLRPAPRRPPDFAPAGAWSRADRGDSATLF